jgi:ubiquinone/menaquinone biosynthesis C-methylase UbiE
MKLVVSGLEILNFADESFDGVFMFGMIEHLGSPKEILKEISRSLKCG